MKETMSAPRQRRFLALAAAAAACVVGLALWYAVPPAPVQDVPASAPEALRESFRVDLNTAGVDELMTLPGIGEKRAEDIIAYRQANGPFRIPEELTEVPGIGEGILEGLIDYVTTGEENR